MKNNENRVTNKLKTENKLLKTQLKAVAVTNTTEEKVINSDLTSIRAKNMGGLGLTFNGKRDMYAAVGYSKEILIRDYYDRYRRQDIAKRVVEAYPDACWGEKPVLTDDEDIQEETPFETTYKELISHKRLKTFDVLKRLDTLANIGEFSILYININDGKDPIEPLTGTFDFDDILYMSPYNQLNVLISKYVTDTSDPYFGLPEVYDLTFNGGLTGGNAPVKVIRVHRSRVIHVAEGALENDIVGIPRLESIYNRLEDLEKVVGGGSETFFLNSRGGLNLVLDKDVSIEDPEALEDQLQSFEHHLTRFLKTQGAEAKPINFHSSDPKQYFDIIIALISAATKIPTRILVGAERGQLASGQDENNWVTRVKNRQKTFCESHILNPFIEFFIKYGIIAKPKKGVYVINWEDIKVISDIEKSNIAEKLSKSIAYYVGKDGNAQEVITKEQFVKDILGIDYREKDVLPTPVKPPPILETTVSKDKKV